MTIAFIFPGQGSQFIGMGKDFYENFREAKDVFLTVDEALSMKLSDIIFDGTIDEINQTINTQPALMAVSKAISVVVEKEMGKKLYELGNLTAGHSLGQYSALCSISSIETYDTAKILKSRASFMQESCPSDNGSMAAIIKPDINKLKEILAYASKIGVAEIANDNSDQQIVISGNINAIDKAIEQLKEFGMRAIKLPVSAPFHSSLMNNAAEKMKNVIDNLKINDTKIPIIDNFLAKKISDSEILKKTLINQIASTVRWRETMMILDECDIICEVGAGKILSNLFTKSYPEKKVINISNIEELKSSLEIFKKYV